MPTLRTITASLTLTAALAGLALACGDDRAPGTPPADLAAWNRSLQDEPVAELAQGARLVPTIADGKPIGYKVFAIRTDSPWARSGFENGDTMVAIEGVALREPEDLARALGAHAGAVRVDVRRRGETRTLTLQR